MDYPWYKTLTDETEIQQGDFIPKCPIAIPPANLKPDDEIEIDIQFMDVIILSQSCDLTNKDVEMVLVCPYYNATDYLNSLPAEQTKSQKARRKILDNLKKGHFAAYHLLNKHEGLFEDYLIVDFKNVYGIHRTTLEEIIKNMDKRIRLLPPYREHLSQAFARYFMRVGLPQDIAIEGY
ncbi:MAG: hypothetical protein PHX54_12665 [Lentimicrobiaceae bacterium]|jgi:hypothetical protein|nr:hypothetical protein [Lentimicrobiaceae bacterium]